MHEQSEKTIGSDGAGGGVASSADQVALGTSPLTPNHDVAGFSCPRSDRIQSFIQNDCHRYVARKYARVFVWANPANPAAIWGFYTLSSGLIQKAELNNKHDRKAEKGIPVPIALIGYMGRSSDSPKGLGAALVLDAARRVSRMDDIGIWGLALDAENDGLVPYYGDLGFISAKSNPRLMYGPLAAFLA